MEKVKPLQLEQPKKGEHKPSSKLESGVLLLDCSVEGFSFGQLSATQHGMVANTNTKTDKRKASVFTLQIYLLILYRHTLPAGK
ncbi:MAG: hypothetical protein M3142_01555 [Bacteroidota bacterium]|nr:hypothetical protein [Bacteroidota bacterium]